MVNISVSGTQIIKRKNINIGMATALPSGNLIVPVIRNADQMSLVGLTKAVNDLAIRARDNNLEPDEVREGTFTVTNVGTFGNVMGTPIINQPQAARSEEHTSELQSLMRISYAVFCLKKKKNNNKTHIHTT